MTAGPDDYLVVVEGDEATNFSAYAPDLPGCVAAADTYEECLQLMREGIAIYLDELRKDGDPVPPPTIAGAAFVRVAA